MDFTKIPPQYFEMVMPDGVRLDLPDPSMEQFEKMQMALADMKLMTELVQIMADVLNGNRQGVKITEQKVREQFTMKGMITFLAEYAAWVKGVLNHPN